MPIPFFTIGTIAALSAGGVGSAAYGGSKIKKANEIVQAQQKRYSIKKEVYKTNQKTTEEALQKLGELKVNAWGDFDRFTKAYEKIKNKPEFTGKKADGTYELPEVELDEIKELNYSAVKLIGAGIFAAGAGGAVAGGALSGLAALGISSTGTVIANLSGAAATNATLAALGGGSLAAGGLGMAGGSMILTGISVAPAIAVGGLFIANSGRKSLKKAEEIQEEVNQAVQLFDEAISRLRNIKYVTIKLSNQLEHTYQHYLSQIAKLEKVVERTTKFSEFTVEEQYLLESTILLVKVLKELTQVELVSVYQETETVTVNKQQVHQAIETAQTVV